MAEASSGGANPTECTSYPSYSDDCALAGEFDRLTVTTPKRSESTCLSPKPRRRRREGKPEGKERRRCDVTLTRRLPITDQERRRCDVTPTRRLPITGRLLSRRLFSRPRTPPPRWSDDESRQLVQFILLYTDGSWVLHKDKKFWDCAGKFIQQSLGTSHCRSG